MVDRVGNSGYNRREKRKTAKICVGAVQGLTLSCAISIKKDRTLVRPVFLLPVLVLRICRLRGKGETEEPAER